MEVMNMRIYVDVNAVRNGNGTEQTPFRKINDAAKIAQPGDEVLVAPGIYREYVDPIHAGHEDARITYRSVEPLGAVITRCGGDQNLDTVSEQHLDMPCGKQRVRFL